MQSWRKETEKPMPWRLFLGAAAGMIILGGVLLWQFILRVQAMLALPEPAHAGGDLAAGVAAAMAEGNARAALGGTGAGAVLWLLIGAVLLTQGLRGRKREQQKEQVQDVR